MSKLLRYHIPGSACFITTVTHMRASILCDNFDILWDSITKVKEDEGLDLIAWVVMPDHLHMIIQPNGADVSRLLKRMKLSFAHQYRRSMGMYRGKVWQSRFWDHQIRDQDDMNRHIDYVHYNPAKHGLASSPFEWEYSSIYRYLEDGYYTEDWGTVEPMGIRGEFGE